MVSSLNVFGLINKVRWRFRQRRVAGMIKLMEDVHRERGAVQVLDSGGTLEYWKIVPIETMKKLNAKVTFVNFKSEEFPETEHFRFVEGNGCSMPEFADNSFDIVHSNSVIEHVGNWDNMVSFANEVRRLAPKYWVQTPYFWFPVEPHCMTLFFHWLPWVVRVRLVMWFSLGNWARRETVDSAVKAVQDANILDQFCLSRFSPTHASKSSEHFDCPNL